MCTFFTAPSVPGYLQAQVQVYRTYLPLAQRPPPFQRPIQIDKTAVPKNLLGFKKKAASFYQANLSNKPPGHLLTAAFLPSSKTNNPIPKLTGKNQYSTGMVVVPIAACTLGG